MNSQYTNENTEAAAVDSAVDGAASGAAAAVDSAASGAAAAVDSAASGAGAVDSAVDSGAADDFGKKFAKSYKESGLSAGMDETNKKALNVMENKGMDAAIKHMFTDQVSGRQLSYGEMRMRYG